jgi:hypothetical protein
MGLIMNSLVRKGKILCKTLIERYIFKTMKRKDTGKTKSLTAAALSQMD